MASKNCPVQRAIFGFMVPAPNAAPISLQGRTATAFQVQQVASSHHELRIIESLTDEGLAYCIFCGEMAPLPDWYDAVRSVSGNGAKK